MLSICTNDSSGSFRVAANGLGLAKWRTIKMHVTIKMIQAITLSPVLAVRFLSYHIKFNLLNINNLQIWRIQKLFYQNLT